MDSRLYAYVRVSTKEQNEERQMIAMRALEVPERNIYSDKHPRGAGRGDHRRKSPGRTFWPSAAGFAGQFQRITPGMAG